MDYVVRFTPVVGREDIGVWMDRVVYENGELTMTLDSARLSQVAVGWVPSGGRSPVLTERHVMRDSDPLYEHYLFEHTEETCHMDETADSLGGTASGGLPDSLTPSTRQWVSDRRAAAQGMVNELTALRDSLAANNAPLGAPDSVLEGALNPIARRNLVLGRAPARARPLAPPQSDRSRRYGCLQGRGRDPVSALARSSYD